MSHWRNSESFISRYFFLISVGIALLFWFLEAFVHVYIFHHGSLYSEIFTPDPHETWMRLIVAALVIFLGLSGQIVTRRLRAAEKRVRHSEQTSRALLNATHESAMLIDNRGTILLANSSMADSIGRPVDSLPGSCVYDLLPPAIAALWEKHNQEVIETGGFVSFEGGRSGRLYDTSIFPLFNGGKVERLAVFSEDITARKRAEEALQRSEREKAAILDSMTELVAYQDRSMNIVWVNNVAAESVNMTREDMIGRRCFELWHGRSTICENCPIVTAIETKAPARTEILSADGRIWDVTGYPVFGNGGDVIGIVEVTKDITNRKKNEAELRAYREHLELINKILRHDLINNFTAIRSALDLYRDSKEPELLENADQQIDRSVDLIRQMRELESFISRHRDLKPVDIEGMVRKIIPSYPSIEFHTAGTGFQVMADEFLESVLDNIIGNAVKHSGTDRIDITGMDLKGAYELHIADHGSGIPDPIKAKIFEEGFSHGTEGGTGLGLHIVKKAMETYGGDVYVENNEPQGTVFILRFMVMPHS